MFIAHRINTANELKQIPENCGVEIDLRDDREELILSHDPFVTAEKFEIFLQSYHHKLLILNIKSERIEHKVLDLLKKYNIDDYFFLDSSFPMIYLLSKNHEKNIAIRFSEFEGIDTIRKMAGKIKWVWIDCFTKIPLDPDIYNELKQLGYKLCFVSPELQGREEDIERYKEFLEKKQYENGCNMFKNKEL